MKDGRKFPAEPLGVAPELDLAILKIGARNLPTLPLLDRYLEWNSFFGRRELDALLLDPVATDVSRSFSECFRAGASGTLLQQILYLNFRTYLLDDLLVKTDRTSMAHALEVRCPFLDTRLIEWAALLPDNLKIRGTRLKYILKRAYRNLLPQEVLSRGKMGFGVPLGAWMRKDLKSFSHDLLLGPSARIRDLLDPREVRNLLREHEERAQDHRPVARPPTAGIVRAVGEHHQAR